MPTTLCFFHELNRSAREIPFKSFGCILRTIASYANPRGDNCYPNLRRIAKSTGYGLTWVHRAIIWAEQTGWLKVNRCSGVSKGKGWRRSSYILQVPHWTGRGKPKNHKKFSRGSSCSPSSEHHNGPTPYRDKPDAFANKPKGEFGVFEQWTRLRQAIPRFGRYNYPQEINQFHGLTDQTRAIIKILGGWGSLCLSTEFDLNTRIKALFVEHWELVIE